MLDVVGIRLKEKGKIYFFDPNGLELKRDDEVIVNTAIGLEYGIVIISRKTIDEKKSERKYEKVERKANKKDREKYKENIKKSKQAYEKCNKIIEELGIDMKLIEAKYLFDNSKLIFYFIAEQRVDFRELVKELASIFKVRIELRQINTRDEAIRLGGNGVCGRELCCCSFLNEYNSISIKMAKEQNLALNSTKITGVCGRLKCCIRYEKDIYEEKSEKLPRTGAIVNTELGEGIVESVEVLRGIVKVKLKDDEGNDYSKRFNTEEIKIIKDNIEENIEDEKGEDYEL